MLQAPSLLGVTVALVGALLACAPSAAPAPAPKAAQASGAADGAPAAGTSAAPAAGTSAAPAGTPAQWDEILAAARREGKVVVAGPPGQVYRDGLIEFQTRYPDIALEYSGQSGRDFLPKVLSERAAGQYLWDILVGGPES